MNGTQAGDQFQVHFENERSYGRIVCREPYEQTFPDSPFIAYCVEWDNGETDRLSAWDMEPCTPDDHHGVAGPSTSSTGVRARNRGSSSSSRRAGTRNTLAATSEPLYAPVESDWPLGPAEEEKKRIVAGLSQVCLALRCVALRVGTS